MRSLLVAAALSASLCALAPAARAQTIDREALIMLTELITVELSEDRRLAVISSTDVREVVALEAEKQAIGCESSASCLAEVADAMGARFVVFGQLGKLGSVYLLSLHLFDSESAAAAGRVVVKGESLEDLVAKTEGAIQQLVGRAVEGRPPDVTLRVLVLDLKPASGVVEEAPVADAAAAAEPSGVSPWLLWGGVAGAGLGGATVVAGVAFAALGQGAYDAAKAAPVQLDAERQLADANAWGTVATVALVTGGVALAAGAGLATVGLLFGDE